MATETHRNAQKIEMTKRKEMTGNEERVLELEHGIPHGDLS